MWLGVDDTDGPQGGCTTHVAVRLAETLDRELLAPPRLVRLDPMAPWKTRGNGAVALHLDGEASPDVARRAWRIVDDLAQPEADPGLVVTDRRPTRTLYEAAVTRLLDADAAVPPDGAHVRGGRGVLGALAAVAWRPADRTFEVLAYRRPDRWGTPRRVDPDRILEIARTVTSAWDCWDADEDAPVMVPNGPDPVLYGLRGDEPDALLDAAGGIADEPVAHRQLFVTNQGTDDHLVRRPVDAVEAGTNVVVDGEVASPPRTIEGGHTFVDLADGTGTCTLAAYEPTKRFRRVVRRLRPGDRVLAVGGTSDGTTVNLEKLRVDHLVEVEEKVANPTCCGRSMDSRGRGAGYRCRRCGARTGEAAARFATVDRDLRVGWYEVPPVARRHLAKPLERLNRAPSIGANASARVAKPGQRRSVQGAFP